MKSRVLILDAPVNLTASALAQYRTAAVILATDGRVQLSVATSGRDAVGITSRVIGVIRESFGAQAWPEVDTVEVLDAAGVVNFTLQLDSIDPSKFLIEGVDSGPTLSTEGVLRLSNNPLRATISLFAPVISRAYHGQTSTIELALESGVSFSSLDELGLKQFVGSMMTALGVKNVDLHFVRGGASIGRRSVYQLILQPKGSAETVQRAS